MIGDEGASGSRALNFHHLSRPPAGVTRNQLLTSSSRRLSPAGLRPQPGPLSLGARLDAEASFPHLASSPRPRQRKQEVEGVGPALQTYHRSLEHLRKACCLLGVAAWALGAMLSVNGQNEGPLGGLGGNFPICVVAVFLNLG